MTVRTRYTSKPTRRHARRDDSRRAVLLTVTFVAGIAVALSLVAGVFVADYYQTHGAPVASVNGEAISKDAVRDRVALNASVNKRLVQDYGVLRNQGKVTPDEYSAISATPLGNQYASISSAAQDSSGNATTPTDTALQQLTFDATLKQYAAKHGISVSDQQVKDQIQADATLPEMRHVMVIGVTPDPTPPANSPTAQDQQAALTKAQGYLDEVKSGTKKWADVATEAGGGETKDYGLTSKDHVGLDPDLVDAIFSLAKPNDVTVVMKGQNGAYRFATVTSIVAPYVDTSWEKSISGDYQGYARAEALQKAVKDSIDKQYIDTPTLQRHVQEIVIFPGYSQAGNGDEVKLSMMVFAPSHDTANAANVATTDAAWTEAKTRADAAVATLRADPTKFATMAADATVDDDSFFRSISGSIPWIPADLFNSQTASGQSGLGLTSVAPAVFKADLAPNQILDPIQETSFGYVVVRFEGRRPAPDQRIADVQLSLATGADFATQAKQWSELADEATNGGDAGWFGRYALNKDQTDAIFSTPVGGVSQTVLSAGVWYVYKVLDEQTRLPDAKAAASLRLTLFQVWLIELQSNTNVWTDQAGLTALSPASPSP
jgi:parvulin-like peptidyl-prolyl isomerase